MKRPFLILAAVLLAALLLSSCIVVPAVKDTAAPTQSATQAPAATAEPVATAEPTATPSPTPVPPKIEFAVISNPAAEKFMQVMVGKPVADAIALLGEPVHTYGQGSYQYKAVAGSDAAVPAAVYRFMVNNVPIELIVGTNDDLVLKKQISTPDIMPRLIENADAVQVADGTPYTEALKLLGVNPYLWMEFALPNAAEGESTYQVAVWPDKGGQFAALVRDGVVLRSEYQPADIVLSAAAVDGITPRVPRYLKPRPGNANGKVAAYSLFKKFAAIGMNAPEQTILSAFGPPTSQDTSDPAVRVLTYEIASADFSGSKAVFAFSLSAGSSSVLVAKHATVLPLVSADVRARYAPQMLGGMLKSEVEAFMGSGFWSDQLVNSDGRIISSYSWAGDKACVSALIPQGDTTVVGNHFALYDLDGEAASLYEEYVLLPLKPGPKPSAKPTPVATPVVTFVPPSFKPLPTPTRTIKLPTLSLIIPSLTLRIPRITPTPTPVIIK